jgi:surfactin synthase thioesterase subunit
MFCLPYAGGGASIFRQWPEALSETTELIAIQPPGREERHTEPCFDRLDRMVDACMKAIIPVLDKPCVFFGHSMGARIAYEIAKRLSHYGNEPLGLIVSGARAPHIPSTDPVYHLADEPLIEEIRKKNGTPDEILRDRELMQLLLPRLRADYTLADTAPLESGDVKLNHNIVALGGLSDPDVEIEKLSGWSGYTTSDFTMHLFEGDHFFIQSSQRLVLPIINFVLASVIGNNLVGKADVSGSRQGAA